MLGKKIILLEDNSQKQKSSSSIFSKNFTSEEFIPYIIYYYDHPENELKWKVHLSQGKYSLTGIVIKQSDELFIYIKTNVNSYWYSVTKNQWIYSIESSITNPETIIKVYTLDIPKIMKRRLSISDLNGIGESSFFPKYIQKELKWLLNNNIGELIKCIPEIISMFGLNNIIKQNELFNFELPWNNREFLKFKDKIISMGTIGVMNNTFG